MSLKQIFSILLLGLFLNVLGQKPSMELSFTAKNYIYYVPLDSINIENLTQGGDTTIYAPDTVLKLDYVTATENIYITGNRWLTVFQNHPNPFKEKTEIRIFLPEKQNVSIIIWDILGRGIKQYSNTLNRGTHSFYFYPGKESYYFLTVTGKQTSKTIKMICSSNSNSYNRKCRLIYKTFDNNNYNLKSGENLNGFVFNAGDELKFTGYTYLSGIDIIDSPENDTSYEFQYTGKPCPSTSIVSDIDGNTYNTVLIGEQCWMKENLKTTTYRNGIPIPNVVDSLQWGSITYGAYAWYENDISWKEPYGALYNWFTGIDTNELCPEGWHVPSYDECIVLTDFIGGWIPPHGDMLKSCRQVNSPLSGDCLTSEHPRWEAYGDYYGTDDFGFSGLPGGNRYYEDHFIFIGKVGGFWTSTLFEGVQNAARVMVLFSNYDLVAHSYRHHNDGFSVRCLKD